MKSFSAAWTIWKKLCRLKFCRGEIFFLIDYWERTVVNNCITSSSTHSICNGFLNFIQKKFLPSILIKSPFCIFPIQKYTSSGKISILDICRKNISFFTTPTQLQKFSTENHKSKTKPSHLHQTTHTTRYPAAHLVYNSCYRINHAVPTTYISIPDIQMPNFTLIISLYAKLYTVK